MNIKLFFENWLAVLKAASLAILILMTVIGIFTAIIILLKANMILGLLSLFLVITLSVAVIMTSDSTSDFPG
jgi:hypothetical protein